MLLAVAARPVRRSVESQSSGKRDEASQGGVRAGHHGLMSDEALDKRREDDVLIPIEHHNVGGQILIAAGTAATAAVTAATTLAKAKIEARAKTRQTEIAQAAETERTRIAEEAETKRAQIHERAETRRAALSVTADTEQGLTDPPSGP